MLVIKLALRVVKFVGSKIIKLISYLMVKLYLWIPFVLGLGYIIASAALPVDLTTQKYLSYFLVIIIAGIVLSTLLSLHRFFIMPIKKLESKNQSALIGTLPISSPNARKAAKPKDRPYTENEFDYVENNFSGGYGPMYKGSFNNFGNRYSNPYANQNFVPSYARAENEIVKDARVEGSIPDLTSYKQFIKTEPESEFSNDFPAGAKLYRTRKDPTLFVMVNGSKLEYYRKTPKGLKLVSIEDYPKY